VLGLPQLLNGGIERRSLDVRQHDLNAFFGESLGEGPTHAARRARYNCHFAGQVFDEAPP
jgi:hypothetical protein